LSPAINDPTTAVLALDQIHHLLLHVGQRRLDAGQTLDSRGQLRLKYGTPDWGDFVSLAVMEIRRKQHAGCETTSGRAGAFAACATGIPPARVETRTQLA
jgi:uncharacterized membrane protein